MDVFVQAGGPATIAANYAFVDITPAVIETIRRSLPEVSLAQFGDYRPSLEPHISVGDTVVVTIWEAEQGGLFSAPLVSDKFSTGSNSATIPAQIVGRDGAITVPYAGRVHVAGLTTRAVQTIIENALQGKAIKPQVLVDVTHSYVNSVTVTGEVANGARVDLSVSGDRLLDVISEAGGVRAPVNATYVQLSRGPVSVRVPLTRVINDPRENIYMRPGDVVALIADPQTFIVYGATGINHEIPFDTEGISLAEALGKAGGLEDVRSDAQGIFVFRYEPAPIARALGVDPSLMGSNNWARVVYRLNMRQASSLFYAQSFQMVNRDVLYVSDAPLTEVQKALSIFTTPLAPAGSAAAIYATFPR
jgi:polysaccharide biosynthesis/export protein